MTVVVEYVCIAEDFYRQHHMDPLCHYGATNTNHYAYLYLQPVNHTKQSGVSIIKYSMSE